jgi:hypothetical protein
MLTRKKKEGRPLPCWEVPRRPKFHQLGCGFEPVRRYNDPKGALFPARDLFLWTSEKAPAPPGASDIAGYQGGAPTAGK